MVPKDALIMVPKSTLIMGPKSSLIMIPKSVLIMVPKSSLIIIPKSALIMVPKISLIMVPKSALIMGWKSALIRDPNCTKFYLTKKPLYTCKPFLIIAITKSFLKIRTLRKIKSKFAAGQLNHVNTKFDICLPYNT